MWLFPGSHSGVSLSFGWLQLGVLVCFVSGFLAGGVYLTASHILNHVLSREAAAFVEGREFGRVSLWKKIDILASELAKARAYEKELRSRASYLNQMLDDAEESDLHAPDEVVPNLSHKQSSEYDLAVGGNDEPETSILRIHPRNHPSPALAGQDKGLSWLLDLLAEKLNHVPLGIPVPGAVSSGFGRRASPFHGGHRLHQGIDLAVYQRSPVLATADGIVSQAGWQGSLGHTVVLDHGNGIETVFGHLNSYVVKVGQKVCRSQRIGYVGTSGRSTGPHLHYEVRIEGEPRDPMKFVELASLLKFIDI